MDRHSSTRYCAFIGGNIISWKSKKQNVVVEAEYRAMMSLICELVWVKQFAWSVCSSLRGSVRTFYRGYIT